MYKQLGHEASLESGEDIHVRTRGTSWSTLRYHLAKSTPLDRLERALSSRKDQFTDITTILTWYRRVASSLQSSTVQDCLWLNTKEGSLCEFRGDETVSQCFDKILTELDSNTSSGVRICALSASAVGVQKAYSFPYEVYLTLSKKIDDASRVFHTLTARLLTLYWAENGFEEQAIEALTSRPVPEPPLWQPQLPSIATDLRVRPLTSLNAVQRPLDIHAATWRDLLYLEWQWLREVPHYDNDVDIYVWEPFKQRPPRDFLRMLALKQTMPGERKVILVAGSSRLLERLGTEPIRTSRTTTSSYGTDAQMFRLFANIYRLIRADIIHFLTQASARVDQINIQGRSSPSGWKIQLLSHLQECHIDIAEQCEQNIETLKAILLCLPLPSPAADAASYEHLDDLDQCKIDLEYLASELRAKSEAITPVKRLIREQMDYSTAYRNTVIAVLVALYVPISFVSSFLGMNITDHSPSHYWRNETSAALPGKNSKIYARNAYLGNYTANLIVTNNPNTRTWSLNSFWVSAFPLALGTIVIPLVAGPLFRWMMQFARRHKVWWRVIVIFLTVGTVLGINLISVASAIDWQKISGLEDSDTGSETFEEGLSQAFANYEILFSVQTMFAYIEFGVLWLLCLWHFWVAFRLRVTWAMRLSWALVSILTLGDWFYFPYPLGYNEVFRTLAEWNAGSIVLPLLPWIVLFLLWIYRPHYFYTINGYRRHRKLQGNVSVSTVDDAVKVM